MQRINNADEYGAPGAYSRLHGLVGVVFLEPERFFHVVGGSTLSCVKVLELGVNVAILRGDALLTDAHAADQLVR